VRTLAKLEAMGLVRLREDRHRTVPTAIAAKFRVVIDPYSMKDRVEVA
jgi:predicted transcriptional regulator